MVVLVEGMEDEGKKVVVIRESVRSTHYCFDSYGSARFPPFRAQLAEPWIQMQECCVKLLWE